MTPTMRALFPELEEDRQSGNGSVTMFLPPSVRKYLQAEAAKYDMPLSSFIAFLIAFYKEHREEAAKLCQPLPIHTVDNRYRLAGRGMTPKGVR